MSSQTMIKNRLRDAVLKAGDRYLRPFFSKNRDHRVVKRAYAYANYFIDLYENHSHKQEVNGEKHLIESLSGMGLHTCFDVGANVGDWTAALLQASGTAQVHCFEIVPQTATHLEGRFRGQPRVQVNRVGLSDQAGMVKVKQYRTNSELASIFDYPHADPSTWVEVPVERGDAYCERNRVSEIDILKIDTEGAEHLILKGFEGMLSRRAIRLVQFEYGSINAITHHLLVDFHNFFRERGYEVGKIFPTHVEFAPYSPADDNMRLSNFIALRQDLPEWRSALENRGSR